MENRRTLDCSSFGKRWDIGTGWHLHDTHSVVGLYPRSLSRTYLSCAMLLEYDGDVTTHPLKARDLPLPEPGTGQVRVKVHVCGVCRTDLHVVEGDLPASTRPIIPGHETVGIVDRLGNDGTRAMSQPIL